MTPLIYPVSQKKVEQLNTMMRKFNLREADFMESFIRSGGSGGQNVNKVSSCVCLIHRPSGVMVKFQKFRTQAMNRLGARQILLEKIEEQRRKKSQTKIQQAQKLKRQKRKRPAALQEKILQKKRIHSEKKAARRPIKIASE